MIRKLQIAFVDFIIVFFVAIAWSWFLQENLSNLLLPFGWILIMYVLARIVPSVFGYLNVLSEKKSIKQVFWDITFHELITLSVFGLFLNFFRYSEFQWEIISGVIFLNYCLIQSIILNEYYRQKGVAIPVEKTYKNNEVNLVFPRKAPVSNFKIKTGFSDILKNAYLKENPELFKLIEESIELNNIKASKAKILMSPEQYNIDFVTSGKLKFFLNLSKINDIRRINQYFIQANEIMEIGGYYALSVRTKGFHKEKILKKYRWGVNWLVYSFDFIIRRLFPKLPITKNIYFFLSKGRGRVISRCETLGRLYSCGFKIINEKKIDDRLHLIVQKCSKPIVGDNPSYGALIRLTRNGKNGNKIKVYKLRTMHPYSEYLQQYIYDSNKLQKGGKFKNDFRVSTIGKFMRKYWIDELPMLINLFRGDLKIVGVRPLSDQYLKLYDEDLIIRRQKYKPGLFPPFYADLPETLDEIMESEKKYMEAYDLRPLLTDIQYLFKALYNIFIRNARSS